MSSKRIFDDVPLGWRTISLGELCESIQTGPFGSQLHAKDYVESGIPSIMPKNISVEGISIDDIAYISEADATRLSKYLTQEGDIVYSRRGDVEKCSLITEKESGWLCGTGCLRVRLGEGSQISPMYLHAYLSHPRVREWITRHAIGATMPNLNTSILSALPVLMPEKGQAEITEGLWGDLIGKIKLNRRTNKTLEQIAQTLFKSWFVDFDPVRAKVAVREHFEQRAAEHGEPLPAPAALEEAKNIAAAATIAGLSFDPADIDGTRALLDAKLAGMAAEQRAQLMETAVLFPSKLTDTELGLIPEGWEPTRIDQILELAYGKSLKKGDRVEGEVPVYGSGGITGTHNTHLETGPGIIIGRKGTVGSIYWEDRPFYPIDTVFFVKPKSGWKLAYVYQLLKTLNLQSMNTDAAVPGLNRNNVYRLKFALPPLSLVATFDEIYEPIRRKIFSCIEQSTSLGKIRDLLLPKLLAGEIQLNPDPVAEAS